MCAHLPPSGHPGPLRRGLGKEGVVLRAGVRGAGRPDPGKDGGDGGERLRKAWSGRCGRKSAGFNFKVSTAPSLMDSRVSVAKITFKEIEMPTVE